MGSGASNSRTKVHHYATKTIQVPSTNDTHSPAPTQPVQYQTYRQVEPSRQQQQQQRHVDHEEKFEFSTITSTEQYFTIWDRDTKLTPPFKKSSSASSGHVDRHQKVQTETTWADKHSSDYNSVKVETTLSGQTNACNNLSTSDRIDTELTNLSQIHSVFDSSFKRRMEQVSQETDTVLKQIVEETQAEQERLLQYAKFRQIKQDEEYRDSLQAFIIQLEEAKSRKLAKLQEDLHEYQDQILEASHIKINAVNEQAHKIKTQILEEEKREASLKINGIVHQIHQISSDEKLRHLGSETITKIDLTLRSNAGTKSSGQVYKFDSNESGSVQAAGTTNQQKLSTKKAAPT